MHFQLTLEDSKTFTKPITVTLAVNFVPDTKMLEYVRNENEKDCGHLVGKASDEVKGEVKLSSQALSRYAGNYQAREPKMKGTITVAGGQLMFSIGGKGAVPLTTLSETGFYFPGGFPMEFVKDDKGTVTHSCSTPPAAISNSSAAKPRTRAWKISLSMEPDLNLNACEIMKR
jgi:hypothetical protein